MFAATEVIMQIKTTKQVQAELEKARIAKGITAYRLLEDAGLSRAAWHQIKARGGNMNLDTLLRLSRQLGVEIHVVRK